MKLQDALEMRDAIKSSGSWMFEAFDVLEDTLTISLLLKENTDVSVLLFLSHKRDADAGVNEWDIKATDDGKWENSECKDDCGTDEVVEWLNEHFVPEPDPDWIIDEFDIDDKVSGAHSFEKWPALKERLMGLEVYCDDADVASDNNTHGFVKAIKNEIEDLVGLSLYSYLDVSCHRSRNLVRHEPAGKAYYKVKVTFSLYSANNGWARTYSNSSKVILESYFRASRPDKV